MFKSKCTTVKSNNKLMFVILLKKKGVLRQMNTKYVYLNQKQINRICG